MLHLITACTRKDINQIKYEEYKLENQKYLLQNQKSNFRRKQDEL